MHFIPDVEVLTFLGRFEIDEGGEQEDHVAAFVHDGGAAVGAADLAGQLVDAGFLGALVPAEVVVAVGEVDVVLVEDGGPLEGGAWRANAGSVFRRLVVVGGKRRVDVYRGSSDMWCNGNIWNPGVSRGSIGT